MQICKCYKIRELDLSDNLLTSVPLEIGNLVNLEILNLDNNPLLEPFSSIYKSRGGIGLVDFCRENNTTYPMPIERLWILQSLSLSTNEAIRVGSYNILAQRHSITKNFPFLPSYILNPDFRHDTILQEILSYNVDILCMQEMEFHSYRKFFSPQLDVKCSYDSVFFPKSRYKYLQNSDKESVDGCVVFWKKAIFQMLEQKNIEFQTIISEDLRFNKFEEIVLRNMRKDNVSTIVLLEKSNKEQFIVANTHLYWDPEFREIKLLQTFILLEELEKFQAKYPKAGIIMCGDFNSSRDSEVVKLILDGHVNASKVFSFLLKHPNLGYFKHGMDFKDAYEKVDMALTHLSYNFFGTIDFIFVNETLDVKRILSPPDPEYFERILTLPSVHLPSDHIFIGAEIFIKSNSNNK